MAKTTGGTDYHLIEKIFDQLSSSVAIALLKDDKLAYEFYGGRKATLSAGGGTDGSGSVGSGAGVGADNRKRGATQSAPEKTAGGKGGFFKGFGIGKGAKTPAGTHESGSGGSGGSAGSGGGGGAPSEDAGVNRMTRFNIGSAASLFTGALIVKLMEFGEIRLTDSVCRFIPAFPYDDVTVFHLLTHTSGLSSASLPLPDNSAAKREFYKKLYEGLKSGCVPGVKYEQYQYGHAILADIVETVSGQMLEELASVLFYMPLGMKCTTYNGAALKDNQYVVPWNHKENRFMGELHTKQSTGQSGVYTTALDLIRFGRMFLNGGEFEGKQVFLESSIEFMLREITAGRFMRTPLFMIKRKVDIYGCFSVKQSDDAVALTGDTGSIIFIDPPRGIVGTALTNSTWVHAVSQNYGNIVDILMSI